MTTFAYGDCQLEGVEQLEFVAEAKASREDGDVGIDLAHAKAAARGENAAIALRERLLARLERAGDDFRDGDRRDERADGLASSR
jgi:hypothetical protein